MRKYFIFVIMFLLCITRVNAASICSLTEQSELREKANNVKINSEIVKTNFTDMGETFEGESFKITILNLSDELYLKVVDEATNTEKDLTNAESKDNEISFIMDTSTEVVRLKFYVYSSLLTSCPNEVYKTQTITIPRYNSYYDMGVCEEHRDLELCEKYVTWKFINEEEFYTKLNKEIAKEEEKEETKQEDEDKTTIVVKDPVVTFLNTYKWYFIGAVSIIVLVGKVIKARKEMNMGPKL